MRRIVLALGAVLVLLGLGAVDAQAQEIAPAPTESSAALPPASTESDGKTVEVRTGVATMSALVATRTVTRENGAYVLHQPVNVLPGATLQLAGETLRLAGGAEPASILVGGTLKATNVTISGGSAPRAELAEIVVRAGGELVLQSSRIVRLGANDAHPGVTVRGAGARAMIDDTTIQRNVRGLFVSEADRVSLRGGTVSHNLQSGVVVHGACTSFAARDVVAAWNKADGFALDTTCGNVSVLGGSANRNGESGLDAQGPTNVKVTGLDAWGNASGVTVRDAATVVVSGATLSANRVDGVTMFAPAGALRVSTSRVDHNVRAGISVSSGLTKVGPGNVINSNDVGVRLVSGASSVTARGNLVVHNVRDGFSIATVAGITIADNRIVDNGDAAFSVARAGDADGYLGTNTVSVSPAIERTRSEDTSDAQ